MWLQQKQLEQHFQINNAKTYIPVVSLFINDNLKFLENVRQGFKRTIFMEQR